MRFAPGQNIGPVGLSTFPPPCIPMSIPPPLRLTAPEPVRFVAAFAKTPGESTAPPLRFCVAIDFDGTLCRSAWPKIGEEMPGAMVFLGWLAGQDIARVLWSCRQGVKLDEALAWLAARGFGREWWEAVNDTPAPIARHYGGDTRKIGFHACVDDRAVGFPVNPTDATVPDWPRIREDLLARFARWSESPH